MFNEAQILRDRYQIWQQLGHNAGRRTLLAQDLHTQDLVVLKVLSFSSDFCWDDLKLFEREAETLKSLSHPAIPCYLDFFELSLDGFEGFVLVQTYIDAIPLQEWIKQGRTFSETEVKQIAAALLNVLIYLHDRNPPVIHRDIKPSNILLKRDRTAHQVGDLYLVDFGSVQTVVREIGTMTIVGTYGYMPPEQFSGRAFPASDLYSLGATLIYLVSGSHPADLLQEDLQIYFKSAHLSSGFAQWLKYAVHPNRKQRFPSATAALQALAQPSLLQRPTSLLKPLTFQKPSFSNVELYKDASTLEITIPPENSAKLASCLFIIGVLPAAIALITLFSTLWTQNWGGTLLSLLFLTAGALVLQEALFAWTASIRIRINQQSLTVTQIASGKYKRVFHADRDRLYKLTYDKPLDPQDSDSRKKRLSSELRIWVWNSLGQSSYHIGQSRSADAETWFYGYLSIEELDWLSEELSNWLGIPITKN